METTKEEQYNVRLYPFYKMLSWDLLFYYSIFFLFLVQVKNISAADVLLGEAFYPIFKFALLMPLTAFSAKIGKRRALIIANLANALSILSYLFAQNFIYVLIGQFFSAIAFDIKGVVETNLLYDNLPKNEQRGLMFSKIDGKATSWYYYIDAVAAVASGFLYVINGYLPLILCFVFCIISTVLSFMFKVTEKDKVQPNIKMRGYIKELKHSYKYMLQSDRLKYLLIFGGLFSGFLSVLVSLRSGMLEQIGVPEQYFGIIFAVLGIISGISAKNQNKIHNHFRNRTLAVIAIPTVFSCIFAGAFVLGNFNYIITLIFILIMFLIQYVARGPFYTLIRRYLNNFTNTQVRNKITSSYNMMESILRTLIALLASTLLRITTASNTVLYLGCIITMIIVLLLDKMSHKVGLKPEEYSPKEIELVDLK